MSDKDFVVKNGIVVNTNLIYATGGKVGINNTTPDSALTLTGNANLQGNVAVLNTITVGATGPATINSTFFSATANNANNLGGAPYTAYANSTGNFTFNGAIGFNSSVYYNNVALYAGGTPGSFGQVLSSDGTKVFWTPITTLGISSAVNFKFLDDQFTGDGSTRIFNLSTGTTTNNAIVVVNGAEIVPTTAYNIINNILTFTSAPALNAKIDVRYPIFAGAGGLYTGYYVFKFTATNGQTTFSGNDNTNKLLAYSVGNITVFKNGTKVLEGAYTATDGSSVVLGSGATAGDVIEIVSFSSIVVEGDSTFNNVYYNGNTAATSSRTTTSTTTGQQQIDAFPITSYRSAQYFVQVTDVTNQNFHAQNITLVHNGSSVFMNEYGAVYSNGSSLATFDSTITSGILYLNFTPVTASSIVRVYRTALAV